MGLDKALGLEDSWSDGVFSLGLVAEDSEDDEGLVKEVGLLVGNLLMELDTSPELRLALWRSEDGLEAEGGLCVAATLDLLDARLVLDMGLLEVGLLLLSLSLRWLL